RLRNDEELKVQSSKDRKQVPKWCSKVKKRLPPNGSREKSKKGKKKKITKTSS
ncbi:hypothetical protein NDU88_000384, partial [Pleurodeles waltl]